MNSTKSIMILIWLCFFQISHAVEKGIITKDKAGFVTSMRFPGNDKGETTVTPKEFFMEVLNVDPSENFVKRLGTRRDIECYDPFWRICHLPAYSIGICNPVRYSTPLHCLRASTSSEPLLAKKFSQRKSR